MDRQVGSFLKFLVSLSCGRASSLPSARGMCEVVSEVLPPHMNVLDKFAVVAYSIGVVNSGGQKSPDFSLGSPQFERRSFLLGETDSV